MLGHPILGRRIWLGTFLDSEHYFADFILGGPLEFLQERRDFRGFLFQALAADAIDRLGGAIDAFWIVKETQLPIGDIIVWKRVV